MHEDSLPQKLATIMSIDVAGYSERTEADQAAAALEVAALRARIETLAAQQHGRVFNTAGDGFMLEFASAASALTLAEELLGAVALPLRVGVHLGDVFVTANGDLLGQGVNIAARLQQLAEPGSALISVDVRRTLRGPIAERLKPKGLLKLPKMAETIEAFAFVVANGASPPQAAAASRFRLTTTHWVIGAGIGASLAVAMLLPTLFGDDRAVIVRASPFVAVLPFDNVSAEADTQYLSDGLSEEILNVLVRTGQIDVAARNSSFQFRGDQKARAAEALGATHVLDGSVRREGDRLRVAAHLIDARDKRTVWSESYDRQLTQSLVLQNEIAERVADALDMRLAPDALRQAQQIDPRAYDHYLHGREFFRREFFRTRGESLRRAIEDLEEAVRLAPDFAPAWSSLGAARMILGDPKTPEGVASSAAGREALNRAIKLDPRSGEALAVLAQYTPVFGRWNEIGDLFERAVAADPTNAQVLLWRALFFGAVGRNREMLSGYERAYELDPLSMTISLGVAWHQIRAGRLEEGKAVLERRRGGLTTPTWAFRVDCNYLRIKEDWAALERLAGAPPANLPADQKMFAVLVRDTASALAAQRSSEFAKLRERWKELAYVDTLDLLHIWFLERLGGTAAAVEVIEKKLAPPVPGAVDHDGIAPPRFEKLYASAALVREERIIDLMFKWGLFDYWRATNKWPDFCADPTLPYDCKAEAEKRIAARSARQPP